MELWQRGGLRPHEPSVVDDCLKEAISFPLSISSLRARAMFGNVRIAPLIFTNIDAFLRPGPGCNAGVDSPFAGKFASERRNMSKLQVLAWTLSMYCTLCFNVSAGPPPGSGANQGWMPQSTGLKVDPAQVLVDARTVGAASMVPGETYYGPGPIKVGYLGVKKQLVLPNGTWVLLAIADIQSVHRPPWNW